jgi:uncharacterized protein (DUF1499 family)
MKGLAKLLLTLAFLAALGGALGLLAASLGTRFGWWDFRGGFAILRWGAYFALGGMLAALLGLALKAAAKAPGGAKRGVAALLLGAVPVAVLAGNAPILAFIGMGTSPYPPVHDITTDTLNPPAFVAVVPLRQASGAMNPPGYECPPPPADGSRPRPCGSGATAAAAQANAYPDIQPIMLDAAPPQAFDRALAAARAQGWEIVASVPEEGRIEATATTFWFGFKDDVVIRVAAAEGGGSRLDIRSKSRVGLGDVGANAKRIRAWTAALGRG